MPRELSGVLDGEKLYNYNRIITRKIYGDPGSCPLPPPISASATYIYIECKIISVFPFICGRRGLRG